MKNKTLNLLILSLIVTIGIWGGYFYMIRHIKMTSGSFEDMKHKIVFAMKKEQAVTALKNKIQNNLKEGVDLNGFLIRPDQSADVVQLIESFGPLTGTKVSTQTVSTEEAVGLSGGVDFLKIIFSIDGSKDNVSKCIELAENLPYNIKINKLSFSKSGDASSTAKWTAGVELVIVKLKDADTGTTTSQ